MRILFVTRDYPPQGIAGTEIFTSALASCLHDMHHEVRVLCVGNWTTGRRHFNGYSEDVYRGVQVTRLHMNWLRSPDPTRYLYENPVVSSFAQRYVAKWKPDVIHVTSCDRISASVIPAVKKQNIPVVISLTDFWFVCPQTNLLRSDGRLCVGQTTAWECLQCRLARTKIYRSLAAALPDSALRSTLTWISSQPLLARQRGLRGLATDMSARKRYLSIALEQADRVLIATDFGRQVVETIVPTIKIDLIPYGHDLKWLAGYPGKTPSDHLRIGYIGGMYEKKGSQVLVQAFRELPGETAATLTLYGRLSDQEFYEYLCLLIGDDSRIRIHGGFSDDEIAHIHANIDICVIPSLCYDFPLIAHEAIAGGSVVVASNIPGLNEIVQDGVNGLLFERGSVASLKSQLQRLISEPGLRQVLQGNLRPIRTIDNMATEMVDIYTSLSMGNTARPVESKKVGCNQP